MTRPHELSPATPELAVTGRQLQGPTLADNLDARDTLLIFLRHLG